MSSPVQLQAFGFDSNKRSDHSKAQLLPISGILIPAATSAFAPLASNFLTPASSIFDAPVATDLMSGSSGALSFLRDKVPYDRIAKWTHGLSKTPTDRWMDVVDGAVRGPNHRWLRHHPIDFAKGWWDQSADGSLRWADYGRHCYLDSITTNGLPLLPEEIHLKLIELGIPPNVLFDWTHLNAFDVTVGSLSVIGGSTHMYLSITGCLPWQGSETTLLTFGMGSLEFAGGIATQNPLLIAGGALDCAAGATSYWQHIHIPEPSLIETLVPGLHGGLVSGSVITATRMMFCWNSSTQKEKAVMATESMGLSVLAHTLHTLSPWLSIPLSVAYTAGKFAFRAAQATDAFWTDNPLSSELTPELCRATLQKVGGDEAVRSFESYLARQTKLSIPDELRAHLAAVPDWSGAPPSAEHVFGLRNNISW